MPAYGPKRTSLVAPQMSAFELEADIQFALTDVCTQAIYAVPSSVKGVFVLEPANARISATRRTKERPQRRQLVRRDKLFRDFDNIPVGRDFEEYLNSQVADCDAMLAIIGPYWLDAKDKAGRRRLGNP